MEIIDKETMDALSKLCERLQFSPFVWSLDDSTCLRKALPILIKSYVAMQSNSIGSIFQDDRFYPVNTLSKEIINAAYITGYSIDYAYRGTGFVGISGKDLERLFLLSDFTLIHVGDSVPKEES